MPRTQKLTRAIAKSMIILFAGKRYSVGTRGMSDHRDAVQEILETTDQKDKRYLASFAVGRLLDIYAERRHRFFGSTEELSLALDITYRHDVNQAIAERLVQMAARAGFHGRFPDITTKLLKRPPSPHEVTLLVSAYVADTAYSSSISVEILMQLAKSCMPEKDARIQCERIEKFEREFREDTLL
ncbi:hypothetical protein FJY93_03195 [Candidatus Kaiserbacteria bacterium]|nr:hypothetical protein [Candidatus Kaiserbacteria bacterium]